MPRIRKIKGGMNARYVEKIINLRRPNNLKSLDELMELGVLREVERYEDEFDKYDKGYYFYDGHFESGDRFVSADFYIEPISQKRLKYKDAILINGNLYNIVELYNWVIIRGNRKDAYNLHISDVDIKKIKIFRDKNDFEVEHLIDYSRYNNLKYLAVLKTSGYVDDDDYLIDKDSKQRINGKNSNEPIKYENAIIINEVLYDINNLLEYFERNNIYISDEDKSKIQELKLDFQTLIKSDITSNNLKSIHDFKRLKFIDENEEIIDREKRKIKDPLTDKPIKYKKAILINGKLYNFEDLYSSLFDGKNIGNYIKTLFGEVVNIEDTIKIYNLKHNIIPYFENDIRKFNKYLQELTGNCKKIEKKIQRINELIIGDLDITKILEISKLFREVIDIYYSVVYIKLVSISTISDLRLIGSINLTNTMIEVLKCFFNCLFALYKFGDSDEQCNSSRITFFNYLLNLIKNINDVSYYTFQLVIAVGFKQSFFSREYLNEFKRILDEVNTIVMTSRENSAEILEIQKKINLYKNEISKIFVSISPSMKKNRQKLLTDAYKSINEEHLNVLKNYFKSQENLLDIYKFCNSRFMNFVNHQQKDNQVLITKAELLSKNNEKLHMKSTQNLEKAKKTFDKYQEYKSPKFFERVGRSIAKNVKTYTRRRVLPEIPTSPEISPSIQVSPPSV